MDPYQPELHEPQTAGSRIRLGWIVAFLLGFAMVMFRAHPDAVLAAVNEIETVLSLKSAPMPASPPKFSAELAGKVDAMTPQAQAELLMDESINHYAGAIEMIEPRLAGWRGNLQMTPKLQQILATAMDSNDLRVRSAALEVYISAYNLDRSTVGVSTLEERVSEEPEARPWALWMLGALGNRGVEPVGVLREEMNYIHDSNEETRVWAVEGLSILGSDEAMEPLLDAMRNDPSPRVRERAACGLAQAGMFTQEQRMSIVPRLIEMAEDSSLDTPTRTWVFHALQDITGTNAGTDPNAWRRWYEEHGRR